MCEEAIQLAYGTSVVLFRCPLMPGIIKLESRHITFILLVQCKTQPKKLIIVGCDSADGRREECDDEEVGRTR